MGQDLDREEDFTTLRITKKDRDLLKQVSMPQEHAWETFRRVLQAEAVRVLKKADAPKMGRKYQRIVKTIERGFLAYRKRGVDQVSFAQLKDWINDNTKDGISSPRLANFLRRRPQFTLTKKERKYGTNEIQCYWAYTNDEIKEIRDLPTTAGWVDIPLAA